MNHRTDYPGSNSSPSILDSRRFLRNRGLPPRFRCNAIATGNSSMTPGDEKCQSSNQSHHPERDPVLSCPSRQKVMDKFLGESKGSAIKRHSGKFLLKVAQKYKNKGSDSIASFRFLHRSRLEAIRQNTTPLPTVALPMPDAGYGESPRSPSDSQEHQRQRNRQQSHSHRLQ